MDNDDDIIGNNILMKIDIQRKIERGQYVINYDND